MSPKRDQWKAYCERAHIPRSEPREAIVDAFLGSNGPLTIRALLALAKPAVPRLSYPTVWRTLKHLVAAGIAAEDRAADNQTSYELAPSQHSQLHCAECGLLIEFDSAELEALEEQLVAALGSFRLIRHRHELLVTCPKDAQGRCQRYERPGMPTQTHGC